MKSYWFLHIIVRYAKQTPGPCVSIEGNAVFEMESESFLPGNTKRSLEQWYRNTLLQQGKITADSRINVYISFVMKIDESGYKEFTDTTGWKGGNFSLDTSEYYTSISISSNIPCDIQYHSR